MFVCVLVSVANMNDASFVHIWINSKLAILGTDVEQYGNTLMNAAGDADAAKASDSSKKNNSNVNKNLDVNVNVKYNGKAPGTDTSVCVITDPDGYTNVLVEYKDFNNEVQ